VTGASGENVEVKRGPAESKGEVNRGTSSDIRDPSAASGEKGELRRGGGCNEKGELDRGDIGEKDAPNRGGTSSDNRDSAVASGAA